jgi:hypothetical protein
LQRTGNMLVYFLIKDYSGGGESALTTTNMWAHGIG